MFLGHYALAFAGKKAAPKVSLAVLFVAVQLVDIIWPFLLLTGAEEVRIVPGITEVNPLDFVHYPFTHSLLMGVVWGILAGGLYLLFSKDRSGAWIVGLAVLSHWFLDFIVHRPDLPLGFSEDTKVGLGMWHSLPLTLITESVMFIAGVVIYLKNTQAQRGFGKWGLWLLAGLLFVINLGNMFGPPPSGPIKDMFWVFMSMQVIIVSIAYFVDRNRLRHI